MLVQLFGEELGSSTLGELLEIMEAQGGSLPAARSAGLDCRDAILIAYPDHIRQTGQASLHTLADFCETHFSEIITTVHLLPFYPWSSDDGFSVIDFRTVDLRYGTWRDVQRLGERFRLMFDAVINHVSVQSPWFQGMLRGEEQFQEYFVTPPEDADLTQVVRPRALPLLTEFPTAQGDRKIWTTFSADQVDLNYQNPRVLLEIIDTLLFYASQGADFLRLDAIAYLWKEPGTSSIHLPQTHWIIQLIRAVLDEVAPHVFLITETNVPHAENISYFGDGWNEAQMIYNFSLPPLVLHAFHTGSAVTLSRWALSLKLPTERATFFNFLASHDGIGINPLRGILSESEIDELVHAVESRGGYVSYKSTPDGREIPYELNINYFDALSDPSRGEPMESQVERFITAHAILFALAGVPGIYFHSLLGSRGWPEGVTRTGRNRTINREKLSRPGVEAELGDRDSLRAQVFGQMSQLLLARRSSGAFDPGARQEVLEAGDSIFAILRRSQSGRTAVCLHNVGSEPASIQLKFNEYIGDARASHVLASSPGLAFDSDTAPALGPHQFVWLGDS